EAMVVMIDHRGQRGHGTIVHVRSALIDVAQGWGLEGVLELHDARSNRRASAIGAWQANVMETIVRHAPSGVAHRAIGLAVEEHETALRSGRHRLLVTLHPLVEGSTTRDHGALIRGNRRRKRVERYALAGKCLLESRDVTRNRLQPADGMLGRHVHFLSGSQRSLGLVFKGSGPAVPEVRLAISDVDDGRGVP